MLLCLETCRRGSLTALQVSQAGAAVLDTRLVSSLFLGLALLQPTRVLSLQLHLFSTKEEPKQSPGVSLTWRDRLIELGETKKAKMVRETIR